MRVSSYLSVPIMLGLQKFCPVHSTKTIVCEGQGELRRVLEGMIHSITLAGLTHEHSHLAG